MAEQGTPGESKYPKYSIPATLTLQDEQGNNIDNAYVERLRTTDPEFHAQIGDVVKAHREERAKLFAPSRRVAAVQGVDVGLRAGKSAVKAPKTPKAPKAPKLVPNQTRGMEGLTTLPGAKFYNKADITHKRLTDVLRALDSGTIDNKAAIRVEAARSALDEAGTHLINAKAANQTGAQDEMNKHAIQAVPHLRTAADAFSDPEVQKELDAKGISHQSTIPHIEELEANSGTVDILKQGGRREGSGILGERDAQIKAGTEEFNKLKEQSGVANKTIMPSIQSKIAAIGNQRKKAKRVSKGAFTSIDENGKRTFDQEGYDKAQGEAQEANATLRSIATKRASSGKVYSGEGKGRAGRGALPKFEASKAVEGGDEGMSQGTVDRSQADLFVDRARQETADTRKATLQAIPESPRYVDPSAKEAAAIPSENPGGHLPTAEERAAGVNGAPAPRRRGGRGGSTSEFGKGTNRG